MAYHNNPVHRIDYFSVRLSQNGDWPATQAALEKAVQAVDPSHMLEYNFLDQRLEDFYKQDIKRGQFFALAATVSIGLACLGLFSLASFMTEQRTKEIGIRKALGATVQQIVMMLSGHYVKLVLCGFIIATPLAIWILNQWLQSFAYRIQISWLSIVAACVISLGIALLTVGYKSLQAAAENPVKSLRSE
jgi:putative ABC transport system permease protein